MTHVPISPAPRWAYLVCWLAVLGMFAVYAVPLDRYPVPFEDESFYTAPAVSAVLGGPFAHRTRPDAPYGDRVWGYHGPLYPRLLVPVFRVFGVSLVAARLPQFIAAHVAILILCGILLARGRTWAAILLAVAWVGDRAQQEVLYARMEGLCLLCLVVGFWGLLTVRRAGRVIAGAALAASCGFQPTALFFPAAGLVWTAARGRRALAEYVAGVGLTALGVFLTMLPDPAAVVEQFLWHARLYATTNPGIGSQIPRLWETLRWSRYWAVAAIVVATGLAAALICAAIRQRRLVNGDPISRLAALFAGCGVLGFVALARCAFPYNLVMLTVWPVVGVATAFEAATLRRRAGLWVAATLLVVAWLPSAAWNVMRTRELLLWARRMDSGPATVAIRQAIPNGETVGVDKYVGLFGWSLGRPVVLLPWHQKNQRPPAAWWLLISDVEYQSPHQLAPEELARRPLVLRTTLYPPECPVNRKLYLLGPAPQTASPAE